MIQQKFPSVIALMTAVLMCLSMQSQTCYAGKYEGSDSITRLLIGGGALVSATLSGAGWVVGYALRLMNSAATPRWFVYGHRTVGALAASSIVGGSYLLNEPTSHFQEYSSLEEEDLELMKQVGLELSEEEVAALDQKLDLANQILCQIKLDLEKEKNPTLEFSAQKWAEYLPKLKSDAAESAIRKINTFRALLIEEEQSENQI